MQYTNIIVRKNIIILENDKELKKKLSKELANITVRAKVVQVSSSINFTHEYRQSMNNINMNIGKKLR